MKQIIITLTDEQAAALTTFCKECAIEQSTVIRNAVASYIAKSDTFVHFPNPPMKRGAKKKS